MVGLVLLLVAQSIMDTACFQKIGKIFFPVDLKFNGMEPTLSIPHIDSWVRVRWENTWIGKPRRTMTFRDNTRGLTEVNNEGRGGTTAVFET